MRVVESEIDAVVNGADVRAGQAHPTPEQLGFGLADEQADIRARRGGAFEGEQFLRLAAVERGERAALPGVISEFGRIHVAEVHDETLGRVFGQELRHLP